MKRSKGTLKSQEELEAVARRKIRRSRIEVLLKKPRSKAATAEKRRCIGTRTDGWPCTFRARTNEGYCERHAPKMKNNAPDDPRKIGINARLKRNNIAEIYYQKNSLPSCPECNQNTLSKPGKEKYFGIQYVVCTNREGFGGQPCGFREAIALVLASQGKAHCQLLGTDESVCNTRERYPVLDPKAHNFEQVREELVWLYREYSRFAGHPQSDAEFDELYEDHVHYLKENNKIGYGSTAMRLRWLQDVFNENGWGRGDEVSAVLSEYYKRKKHEMGQEPNEQEYESFRRAYMGQASDKEKNEVLAKHLVFEAKVKPKDE